MRILAIESSAVTASVAILTDDVLTAEYTVNYITYLRIHVVAD